jgi:hypothetical protein
MPHVITTLWAAHRTAWSQHVCCMLLHLDQDGQAGRPFKSLRLLQRFPKCAPRVTMGRWPVTVDGCCEVYCCINLKVNVLLKIIKEHLVLAMYLFRTIVAISNYETPCIQKPATVSVITVTSLRKLLLCVHHYQKSVLIYKYLLSDTCHPDTVSTCAYCRSQKRSASK